MKSLEVNMCMWHCGKDILHTKNGSNSSLMKWKRVNMRSTSANIILQNFCQTKKRLVLVGFPPLFALFFAFPPFPCKIQNAVKAQTFYTNSGRVATAYSTDKYKQIQKDENRAINYATIALEVSLWLTYTTTLPCIMHICTIWFWSRPFYYLLLWLIIAQAEFNR